MRWNVCPKTILKTTRGIFSWGLRNMIHLSNNSISMLNAHGTYFKVFWMVVGVFVHASAIMVHLSRTLFLKDWYLHNLEKTKNCIKAALIMKINGYFSRLSYILSLKILVSSFTKISWRLPPNVVIWNTALCM